MYIYTNAKVDIELKKFLYMMKSKIEKEGVRNEKKTVKHIFYNMFYFNNI